MARSMVDGGYFRLRVGELGEAFEGEHLNPTSPMPPVPRSFEGS